LNVPIGSDLRIGRARDLYATLIQGAVTGTIVIIDAAEVAKVDAAGLQCVFAAAVHLRTAGATWRWHNPSPALKSAAQLLGLDGALELT
jgi:anti-anti-sigma regulatory factor